MVAEIIDCEDAGRNAAESEAEEACIDRYGACLKEIGQTAVSPKNTRTTSSPKGV